ncbi:MAG: ATP-binding protein, partial [Verrucomicrobiota bacterium]
KSDTRFFKDADEKTTYDTRNLVAVPMRRGDRLIGVLEILNKNNNGIFNNDDVKLLEFMGDQAALAIENAYLIRDKVKAERLAAVGTAVASIAHYAKNLIHGVKGSSEIIELALDKQKYDMVADTWPILTQSLKRISELVKDMLTYSKPRVPQLVNENLNTLLRDIHVSQLDRANELNVDLILDVDDDLPNSWFDTNAIHDTTLNFTTNAIEACENLENAQVTLETGFDEDTGMVYAKVKDNGPGIPPDIQKKIFEPFYSTKAGKGTGLGLAVCRKYIEEHQGELDFESEPDEGTLFGIRLPVEPEGHKLQPGEDDSEPALFA